MTATFAQMPQAKTNADHYMEVSFTSGSIGPGGHSSAGHDLDTGAGSKGLGDGVAGFDFADATQSCALDSVGSTDCVAIAGGAVERRIVAVGADVLGESVAEGISEIFFQGGARVRGDVRRGLLNDEFASLREGEHQGVLSQTGYCNAAAGWALIL